MTTHRPAVPRGRSRGTASNLTAPGRGLRLAGQALRLSAEGDDAGLVEVLDAVDELELRYAAFHLAQFLGSHLRVSLTEAERAALLDNVESRIPAAAREVNVLAFGHELKRTVREAGGRP